jgi:hypothetical protein
LKQREDQVKFLQSTLAERDAEVSVHSPNWQEFIVIITFKVVKLKHALGVRERDYLAHSTDCEAQLVRLRSEVTRISQSYHQLKAKRHQRDRESRANQDLKQELEMVKLSLHLSNEELKTAVEKVSQLEADKCEHCAQQLLAGEKKEASSNTLCDSSDDRNKEQYIVLQPIQTLETSHLLDQMFDKHSHHLNHEIHKVLSN